MTYGTPNLTSAYQYGVQNIYSDGDTTALLRLSTGLFAQRMWHWATDAVPGSETAPQTVSDGVAGLHRAETVAHGTATLGDLVEWSAGYEREFMRPGLVLGHIFNKSLVREGLHTFQMMGLGYDVSLLVRLVEHATGPCLIVSHGVDAIFVMALTHGEIPGKPAPVKVVRR